MTRKQTSAKVSKLAARYLSMTIPDLVEVMTSCDDDRRMLAADIRTLAASCLSQDEVKGGKPKTHAKATMTAAALKHGLKP